MAQALDLEVVVEGIETDVQADLLQALACEYGQGYLFSRPVTAEQFELLLLKENRDIKLVG